MRLFAVDLQFQISKFARPTWSELTMQHYSCTNMGYDESGYFGLSEAFGLEPDGNDNANKMTTAGSLLSNFTGTMDRLDPSASFPGLGELPSNGIESGVENNLMSGTFTGDLNSTTYEVGEDHSHLLQEMLHQQSQPESGQSHVSEVQQNDLV